MMYKNTVLTFVLVLLVSCNNSKKRQQAIITTKFGTIKIELYNETPLHRDNFIKLIKDSVYTNLLFHRTIKNFVSSGGRSGFPNSTARTIFG
ncbi:MAG: peptidylprolyl isomerase [Chloroflexia bacterium]|nr:peptidylprolyl isomerase [Chloroflexia bacterium]